MRGSLSQSFVGLFVSQSRKLTADSSTLHIAVGVVLDLIMFRYSCKSPAMCNDGLGLDHFSLFLLAQVRDTLLNLESC